MKALSVTLEDGTEATVFIDGMTLSSMHFDGLDEIEGIKEMRRASDVEFDASKQVWCAIIRKEFRRPDVVQHSYRSTKRSGCIKWERDYLGGK